jgi:flagellar motor switch protein FliM
MLFGDFLKNRAPSCCGVALVRPQQFRMLLDAKYAALFPIIGIALGAKPGKFASPERKPTEIELQLVNLIFKLVVSEVYRAWAAPLQTQFETASLEVEIGPARSFAATDAVLVTRFRVALGEHAGQLSVVAPVAVFTPALAEESVALPTTAPSGSTDAALELLMPANVSLDVWLDGSEMRLGDLLQLSEGQIVKLDHPVERKAVATLNGRTYFGGQIVSTGTHRAFMLDERR